MQKYTILVVDDEEHILELLKYNLESSGFEVVTALNVKEAFDVLEEMEIDTILLDVMLPDMDGVTALKKLRQWDQTEHIPVIMVTAKAEEIDKIVSLELGADDYITKPFSLRELVARVNAVVRRHKRSHKEEKPLEESIHQLTYKTLRIDLNRHKVYCNETSIELAYKEFELLKLLMGSKEKVFTRESLLNQIWGYDYYGETRTVDVHIRYLRSKLAQYGLEDAIETVRGVGYRFAKEE